MAACHTCTGFSPLIFGARRIFKVWANATNQRHHLPLSSSHTCRLEKTEDIILSDLLPIGLSRPKRRTGGGKKFAGKRGKCNPPAPTIICTQYVIFSAGCFSVLVPPDILSRRQKKKNAENHSQIA